jgi:hypothetical protein
MSHRPRPPQSTLHVERESADERAPTNPAPQSTARIGSRRMRVLSNLSFEQFRQNRSAHLGAASTSDGASRCVEPSCEARVGDAVAARDLIFFRRKKAATTTAKPIEHALARCKTQTVHAGSSIDLDLIRCKASSTYATWGGNFHKRVKTSPDNTIPRGQGDVRRIQVPATASSFGARGTSVLTAPTDEIGHVPRRLRKLAQRRQTPTRVWRPRRFRTFRGALFPRGRPVPTQRGSTASLDLCHEKGGATLRRFDSVRSDRPSSGHPSSGTAAMSGTPYAVQLTLSIEVRMSGTPQGLFC